MSFFIGPESVDLGSHFSSFGFHLSALGFQVDLGGLNSSLSLSWWVAFYKNKNKMQFRNVTFKSWQAVIFCNIKNLYTEIKNEIAKKSIILIHFINACITQINAFL